MNKGIVLLLVVVSIFASCTSNAKEIQEVRDQTIEDMVVTVLQQTNNCSSSTIRYDNFTREIVDSQCALQAINNAYLQAMSEMYIATQNCSVATLKIGNYTRQVIDIACINSE